MIKGLFFLIFALCSYADCKVLVGSPIRQKPAILHEFLSSLQRLDRDGYAVDFYFVDDNDSAASKQQLEAFAKEHCCKIISPEKMYRSSYICSEKTHFWKEDLIWRVAQFKDDMIAYAREQGYDFLFLIDSDIVLHPRTVRKLIDSQREIVSNIFWTRWQPNEPELPQVWLSDSYTLFEMTPGESMTQAEALIRQKKFLDQLRIPGVYEVGGLGACTLISKSAMDKGVSFRKIKNLTFWGEDRHFCIRAAALGVSLFVDTHYPAYHIYRETHLPGVAAFVKNSLNDPEKSLKSSF